MVRRDSRGTEWLVPVPTRVDTVGFPLLGEAHLGYRLGSFKAFSVPPPEFGV